MTYRVTEWPWMLRDDPELLKLILWTVLWGNDGDITGSAEELGFTRQSLYNYIEDVGIELGELWKMRVAKTKRDGLEFVITGAAR